MRIAISGPHRTGKTTLRDDLAELLPGYATVDEPYRLLEEDGHAFAAAPTIADFEAQLERSIAECLRDLGADVLFDRCPLDLVAYLLAHDDADAFQLDDWRARVSDAMRTLDLIVLVAIEPPGRIALPDGEDRAWQRRVGACLDDLLDDDPFELDADVLVVEGDPRTRVQQVLARLAGAR